MEDAAIVELYLARDESAIAETAEKYGPKLRRLADRLLHDPPAAEDCENDAYLQAWELIPPHEPRTYLFPFLGRIVRHLAIDVCRRRSSEKRSAVFCELTGEMAECLPSGRGDEAESAAEAAELIRLLNAFLDRHREEQRNVFVRRYWYFDTVPEIGRRYGFSQSKVKMMLSRMREELRAELEKEGYTP